MHVGVLPPPVCRTPSASEHHQPRLHLITSMQLYPSGCSFKGGWHPRSKLLEAFTKNSVKLTGSIANDLAKQHTPNSAHMQLTCRACMKAPSKLLAK